MRERERETDKGTKTHLEAVTGGVACDRLLDCQLCKG